jgi:hypothetical protein
MPVMRVPQEGEGACGWISIPTVIASPTLWRRLIRHQRGMYSNSFLAAGSYMRRSSEREDEQG